MSYRGDKFRTEIAKFARGFATPPVGMPHVFKAVGGRVEIILLDSPFHDTHDTAPHHGELGKEQIDALREILEKAGPEIFRIVLLHHHVTPWRRLQDAKDFSLLVDAHDLIELLKCSDVKLVIHGHQHRPGFDRIPTNDGGSITVVGAGSATAWKRLPTDSWCSVHAVVLNGVDGVGPVGAVLTRVLSASGGWARPTRKNGIPARYPIGPQPTAAEREAFAKATVERCRERKFVKLPEALARDPACRHWSHYEAAPNT